MGEYLLESALKVYNIDLAAQQRDKNQWGKPFLTQHRDIDYNVSHCEGCAAVIVERGVQAGIDVERLRPYNARAAKRVLNENELDAVQAASDPDKEFFKYWTLKESFIKAVGMGMSMSMKDIAFELDGSGVIRCSREGCSFRIFDDHPIFIAATCIINKKAEL